MTTISQPVESGPTFVLAVDGVGTFTFRRRTTRLQIAIQAEFARLTEGLPNPPPELIFDAGRIALLKVLTEKAPDGWPDLYEMDPFDGALAAKVEKVAQALLAQEKFFRKGGGP
jgi:hypothetical protein